MRSLWIALGMAALLFFYGYLLSTSGHDHSSHEKPHVEEGHSDHGHGDHDHDQH